MTRCSITSAACPAGRPAAGRPPPAAASRRAAPPLPASRRRCCPQLSLCLCGASFRFAGGAFPEIHVAQYPLDMGRPDGGKGGSAGGGGGTLALTVNAGKAMLRCVRRCLADQCGNAVPSRACN